MSNYILENLEIKKKVYDLFSPHDQNLTMADILKRYEDKYDEAITPSRMATFLYQLRKEGKVKQTYHFSTACFSLSDSLSPIFMSILRNSKQYWL